MHLDVIDDIFHYPNSDLEVEDLQHTYSGKYCRHSHVASALFNASWHRIRGRLCIQFWPLIAVGLELIDILFQIHFHKDSVIRICHIGSDLAVVGPTYCVGIKGSVLGT